jgi:hypothetical protein
MKKDAFFGGIKIGVLAVKPCQARQRAFLQENITKTPDRLASVRGVGFSFLHQ